MFKQLTNGRVQGSSCHYNSNNEFVGYFYAIFDVLSQLSSQKRNIYLDQEVLIELKCKCKNMLKIFTILLDR